MQEVCAIFGMGLFAFGLWEIYHPASFLFCGSVLFAPFVMSLRGK